MVNFASGGSSSESSGAGFGSSSDVKFGVQGGSVSAPKPDTSIGKFQIDLTDPSSIVDAASSGAKLIGGLAGGALGLIGQVGVPGGPTLGDVPGAIGAGLGAVGSVKLPYAGPEGGQAATIGDIPGEALNILGAPERAVERTVAGQRVEHAKTGQGLFNEALPPDLQAKLDAGASIDEIADELVARNAGFTNNPLLNLGAGLIFDPMNLILPGVGKAGALAGKYGLALRTADEAAKLNVGERFAGAAYNTAMRGLPAAMGNVVDKALGGTTSAVFRSFGIGTYHGLRGGLAKISTDAADRLDVALGKFQANLSVAAMQDELGREVQRATAGKLGRTAEKATASDVLQATAAAKVIRPDALARKVENLLDKVAPNLSRLKGQDAIDWAKPRLAEIAGISEVDAVRVLGKNPNEKTLQMIHGAFYAQAGGDLTAAKAALAGDQAARDIIPRLDDLTIIGEDHLTQERADKLLGMLKSGDPAALDEAAKYQALQKYTTLPPEQQVSKLKELLPKVRDNLPRAVREAVSGNNPLPTALGEWRAKYQALGYDLGFAPESGVKVLDTPDGAEIFVSPFVHFVDEADRINARNPLGRAMDSLFRGVTQTKIVNSSRNRMVRLGNQVGLSDYETKAIHQAIINKAVESGKTVRGLSVLGGQAYDNVFRDVLGDARFAELRKQIDPTFMVMKSFEGNLSEVGLTQKFTGGAKTFTSMNGNFIAGISEGIYPDFRFRFSPGFQAQELVESPILNAMRGIRPKRVMDPEVAKVYGEMLELSPEYRMLDGAEYVTKLAGEKAVEQGAGPRTKLSLVLNRFPNVKNVKEGNRVAQIASENPEAFKDAVTTVNPRAWRTMEEAYGTTDAAEIARKFMQERMALTRGTPEEAVRVLDAAKPVAPPEAFGGVAGEGDFVPSVGQKVYHGSRSGFTDSFIDSDGNLHLNASENFGGRQTGVSLTESRATAEDYASRISGSGVRQKGGVVFEIDASAFKKGALYRESGEEVATRGSGTVIIPKGKFVVHQGEGGGIDAAVSKLRSEYANAPQDEIASRIIKNVESTEFAESQHGLEDATSVANVGTQIEERALDSTIATRFASDEARQRLAESIAKQGEKSFFGPTAEEARSWVDAAIERSQRVRPKSPGVYSEARPITGSTPTFASADEETVWQAFRAGFEQTAKQAFTTHYFNPERGWLERTLNHPYLGIYPLSYATKMVGEFSRFLLARPFGLKAPLLGLDASRRVQQAIVATLAADPDGLGKFVKDHPDTIYTVSLLLPYTPYDIGGNAPAYARHAISGTFGGIGVKKNDIGGRISGEFSDVFSHLGIARDFNLAAGVGSELVGDTQSQLDQAARMWDGMNR